VTVVERRARHETGGTHHIEYARGKAEQKKHRKSPGRNAQQAIDQPADAGTDQDACNEFAGEAKAPGVARCSRRLLRTSAVRRIAAGMARLAGAFIEPLESHGESGLVGLRLHPVARVTRAPRSVAP